VIGHYKEADTELELWARSESEEKPLK